MVKRGFVDNPATFIIVDFNGVTWRNELNYFC